MASWAGAYSFWSSVSTEHHCMCLAPIGASPPACYDCRRALHDLSHSGECEVLGLVCKVVIRPVCQA